MPIYKFADGRTHAQASTEWGREVTKPFLFRHLFADFAKRCYTRIQFCRPVTFANCIRRQPDMHPETGKTIFFSVSSTHEGGLPKTNFDFIASLKNRKERKTSKTK